MSYSIFSETMVDMTWPEVEKAAKEGAIVLFPTAVIEEHGPHMALGVDVYGAHLSCKMIRKELELKGVKAIIAPAFYWGINNVTGAFPGSFTSRAETVKALLTDALVCLNRWGFEKVFMINQHGDPDHVTAILEGIREASITTGVRAYFIARIQDVSAAGLTGSEFHVLIETPAPAAAPAGTSAGAVAGTRKYADAHAGRGETSMMAYYFPDLVDKEVAKTLKATELTRQELVQKWFKGWSDARKMTPLGYAGDPAAFDAEQGKHSREDRARRWSDLIAGFIKGNYQPPETP